MRRTIARGQLWIFGPRRKGISLRVYMSFVYIWVHFHLLKRKKKPSGRLLALNAKGTVGQSESCPHWLVSTRRDFWLLFFYLNKRDFVSKWLWIVDNCLLNLIINLMGFYLLTDLTFPRSTRYSIDIYRSSLECMISQGDSVAFDPLNDFIWSAQELSSLCFTQITHPKSESQM